MIVLSCNNLNKSFGIDSILENVNFTVNEYDKIGIIGVNGTGKTTLFKIISGIYGYDSGDIYTSKDCEIGYLEQNTNFHSENTILEEVLDPSIQSLNWLESTGKPYVMARIINIRKTVRLLGFQGEGRKILKITDPVLEENNGCFILTYGHGNVKLDKVKEEQLMEDIEFDLTIGELTAHIFGYKIIEGLPLVCKKDSFFINDYL